MKRELFQDGAAGRVVQETKDGKPYWAFVPNPLPPDLAYDNALIAQLSKADRALAELAGLARNLKNPHLLIRPFMRKEAVLSSRIEGTYAAVAEVFALEAGQLSLPGLTNSPSHESDIREVANYITALEHGLARLADLPVCERLIKEMHGYLMSGVRGSDKRPGEFRTGQVIIGSKSDTVQTAEYVPPNVESMLVCMRQLESYLQPKEGVAADEELAPLIKLALIHYQFEAIHPFFDGNGRIGRALITLLLVNWNLLPLPLLYLSAYFDNHRNEYYDHLLSISQKGTFREWIMFFLQGVSEQAHDAVTRASRLQALQEEWRQLLTEMRSSALVLKLVDHLFEQPVVTIPQAAGLLEMTYRGAKLTVDKLVDAGILTPIQGPSVKVFLASKVLDVVDADL